MEEEKETAEEKEKEDKEEELHHHIQAAPSVDHQDLPIMHWEDLSKRIAELEKQEQERRERLKRAPGLSRGGLWRDVWEEEEEEEGEDFRRCRVSVVTSRQTNLQLCFINDSESEEEEEKEAAANQKVTMGTGRHGRHVAGLKQEVVATLRSLRDELLAEQKEEERAVFSSCVAQRKHLDFWQLQKHSVLQLSSLKVTVQQEVHALSSELVTHLLVRDQLRTKQDAMLLDVQDLT